MSTHGERLKLFVDEMFRTRREFADELGVDENSLSKYLGSGKKSLFGAAYRQKLSKLGLNIGWYVSGEGEMLTRKPGERVKNPNAEYGDYIFYQTIPDLKGKTLDEIVKLKQDIKSKIEYLNNYMKQIDEEILKITDM